MTRGLLIVGLGHVGITYAHTASIFKGKFESKYKLEVYGYDKKKEFMREIELGEHPLSGELKIADVDDPTFSGKVANCVLICISTKSTDKDGHTRIDASNILDTIKELDLNPNTIIIIKSTVPVGFCDDLAKKIPNPLFFCPEFLREGTQAVNDVFKVNRIYLAFDKKQIGHASYVDVATRYLNVIYPGAHIVVQATFKELEMMKLARNSWHAMRVSFFNELHRICSEDDIDTENVIDYMCGDSRIGDFYNTLSFGFGGYCLPKDSEEMLAYAKEKNKTSNNVVGFSLLDGIQKSNSEHLWFHFRRISEQSRDKDYIIFYHIGFKETSDNPVNSSTVSLMNYFLRYTNKNIKVIASDKYEVKSDNDRISFIKDNDVVEGDFVITEWKISEAINKFKNCKIYHPRML